MGWLKDKTQCNNKLRGDVVKKGRERQGLNVEILGVMDIQVRC
jgi:hypothetical protein